MTQLWSSEDEQSLVWDLSIWPGRLKLERSVVSNSASSIDRASSTSSAEEQSFVSTFSSQTFEAVDSSDSTTLASKPQVILSVGGTTEFSSSEEASTVVDTTSPPLQPDVSSSADEEAIRPIAVSGSLDIDSVSSTEENALFSGASLALVQTVDTSQSNVVASEAEVVSSIDGTTEFSASKETASAVTISSPTLQPDVFSSTDEETILSLSAGKTERTLSSSKSNELLSIESEVPSVSLFAPDASVDTVAVIDEREASPALSEPITTEDFSSSVDEPINTGSEASPSESFEIRSVIERDALNPSISASPTGSRNILSLDFNFLVGVNSTLLISDDKETISSEDVTEIEDETNIVIVKPSENEVILE